MNTRPCDICLSCESDAGVVFLDLKVIQQKSTTNVQAIRMSFDGHGCCDLEHKQSYLNPISGDDANRLVALWKSWKKNHCHKFTADEENFIIRVIMKYSEANQSVIWIDALIMHGLVQLGEEKF